MKSILLAILGMWSAAVSAQNQNPWSMINGNAWRTSAASMDLNFPLVTAQLYQPGYDYDNGMTVLGDMLFISDSPDSNHLKAMDLTTGDVQWDFGLPGTGGSMSFIPASHGGIVLAGGQNGAGLYGLDSGTGNIAWFLPVKSLYTRVPVLYDGLLYQPTFDSLVCADVVTGSVNWSYQCSVPQIAPVVDTDRVYFVAGSPFGPVVTAADRLTGEFLWDNPIPPTGHFTSLSLESSALYMAYDSTIAALNKSTGDTIWQVHLGVGEKVCLFPGAFAQHENALLVKIRTTDPSTYLILDKATGEEITRYQGRTASNNAPTIINNYLVEYGSNRLFFLDLYTGEEVYQSDLIPVGGTPQQIVVTNNRIYIAGNGPNIVALESSPSATTDFTAATNFQIAPSPASTYASLQFELLKPSQVEISVTAIAGEVVYRGESLYFSGGRHTVDLPVSDFPPGTYLVTMNEGRFPVTKVFVVQ
jgi:outer membrane protein assembly factor BamB